MPKKLKTTGYAEYDEGLVVGRLGLKVYKSKQAMKDEGFPDDEIAYVEVKIIYKPKLKNSNS